MADVWKYSVYDFLMNVDILMNVDCYSLLCVKVRFARLMMCYNETTTHTHETLQGIYILNVIKLSKDICIEVRDWTEKDLQMTIDARKIISNLEMPLENVE